MPTADGKVAARLVVLVAAIVGGVALTISAQHGIPQWSYAAWFAALVLVGELLRVNLPGDRDTSPVGGAAAIGYSLLVQVGGGTPARHSAALVIAVVFAASMLASGVQLLLERDPRLADMARRVLVIAVVAVAFRGWLVHALAPHADGWTSIAWVAHVLRVGTADAPIVAMVVAVTIGGVLDVVLAAGLRAARLRAPFVPAIRNEAKAQAGIGTSMAATGLLIALAFPQMGLWALPIFAVMLLVTQFSFRRYASIKATYRQTIRALSRVTEVGGHVEPGHSRRVTSLSLALGREFGFSEDELLELEYAALMHDIGQLSLVEPIPRGSTLTVPPSERKRIAELGADVIRSTGNLATVADIVENQAQPYRKMREADSTVPLAARIIKATSAYDDLVTAGHDDRGPRGAWDALERLRLGMAYEYDPRVVSALTRVLTKTGAI
ncbi:MAG: HD domain-containing protein [Frankia sp.]|nr:HD domain-containing protein [Frankia sp.]